MFRAVFIEHLPLESRGHVESISPLGILFYFCLYKTQEDIKHIFLLRL